MPRVTITSGMRPFENAAHRLPARVGVQRGKVGHLDPAEQLYAPVVEIGEKAGKLQTGPVEVGAGDRQVEPAPRDVDVLHGDRAQYFFHGYGEFLVQSAGSFRGGRVVSGYRRGPPGDCRQCIYLIIL